MRICDLTHAYTATSGGIRTYIDAKRRYIRDETDWEHVLIYPAAEYGVERDGRLTTVRLAGPTIPGAAPYRLFVQVRQVVRELLEARPDVVELSSLYTCPWVALRYRERVAELGKRAIVSAFYFTDLPGAYVEPAFSKLLGGAVGRVARKAAERYVRTVMNRVDQVFTSFPDHEAQLRDLGVTAPLRNVPLGVDLTGFHPELRSEAVRARFGCADGGLLLVYAGRLDIEKKVRLLVDAFEKLPPAIGARLVMLGEGRERAMLAERAAKIRERFGEDRLFVLAYTNDKAELARILASADVYVTAGPHETFGLSVAEAQAAGLPVVGVAAGALIDRVADGTGLLGPVGDSRALANNILRVAANHRQMGAAARDLVATTLSWEHCFSTTFGIYERLLHGAPEQEALEPAI